MRMHFVQTKIIHNHHSAKASKDLNLYLIKFEHKQRKHCAYVVVNDDEAINCDDNVGDNNNDVNDNNNNNNNDTLSMLLLIMTV
jgi:hypothetical protein